MSETVGPLDPDTGRWKGVPAPDVILEMERAGKEALLASGMLPIKVNGFNGFNGSPQTDEDIEALGIVLGAPVDDLFRHAVLPPGWSLQGLDGGDLWSYVVDDKGERRVAVGYKAAPYDRWAMMRLVEP